MYDKLMDIYNRMYLHFGSRHWWPADAAFEVVVGAILTQNVAWKNVEQAIQNLKAHDLLQPHVLVQIDLDKLANLIRPTRYFNMKAKKLRAFCQHLMDNYAGSLECFFEKELWALREELLSIYGIGEETADSILLYAAQKPIFVVDTYTRRIFSRLGQVDPDIKYEALQKFFMENIPPDIALYNEYHALIDAVGSHYCAVKKPLCRECPLKPLCKFTPLLSL
jgi:endonuclease-3 related protein